MGRYTSYGILVLCICFIHTFGYERCSYGIASYYCSTGTCCKISGTWYCTGILYSLSDCDSFAHTTTTEAPRTYKTTIYGTVATLVFLALVAVVIVSGIRYYKRKHTQPSPVVHSPTVAVIYKV